MEQGKASQMLSLGPVGNDFHFDSPGKRAGHAAEPAVTGRLTAKKHLAFDAVKC
jgi:hypothetical protein